MAITLSPSELFKLWMQMYPRGRACNAIACNDCPTKAYMACRMLADEIFSWSLSERRIKQACNNWRDYTDKACDTYTCTTCPDYAWCTTLRGIAIEGVKLDND